MSIFVTSLGATDNEICAPISFSILSLMNKKGFKFKGIPSVESKIHIKTNKVDFQLKTCNFSSSPITLTFEQVNEMTHLYHQKEQIPGDIKDQVMSMLNELEQKASCNCAENQSCSYCVLTTD